MCGCLVGWVGLVVVWVRGGWWWVSVLLRVVFRWWVVPGVLRVGPLSGFCGVWRRGRLCSGVGFGRCVLFCVAGVLPGRPCGV